MDQEEIFVRYINDAAFQKVVNELADGRGVNDFGEEQAG